MDRPIVRLTGWWMDTLRHEGAVAARRPIPASRQRLRRPACDATSRRMPKTRRPRRCDRRKSAPASLLSLPLLSALSVLLISLQSVYFFH